MFSLTATSLGAFFKVYFKDLFKDSGLAFPCLFSLILISRHDSMLVSKKCRGGESKTFKKKSSGCGIAVFSNVSSRVY